MSDSILDGKKILIVDDETDVLAVLEDEIMGSCPNCVVEKAGAFDTASRLLSSNAYDVVILDIMGVKGFDLLDIAVKKGFKVVMLTAHALSPEALRRSIEMKARAYLPKDKLGEVVPFLEDVLRYDHETGWKRLFATLHKFFMERFEEDWDKDPDAPWRGWPRNRFW